ncbi:MAG: Stage III sporulation protein J [uncultured bacterium]|uniref:Preprotein translocase YidC subunit n=3 Tax=Candidatus Daviesiibacteriota TaxID=1752718 RepID=A0A0G0H6J5_9BACT|nr:MAG: Stage III sporulation protein J [uncultured bacterium]KKQ07684.1 MAG: Preprotein translocase YidC subunit [Candidatus Daviesbacteria bacterium GW2011_GWB1_36_5]KKQ15960.1 MAG: Preprotein translocase YidC subunit [Candidatus Daviesbacteria bacterium GW2011_GWA1_36_8]OGE33167.1 MAG: hypothetical protein A3C99_00300 [Candidatus Daviesbacteria bacterium RIFCSPHIGHO2_02_FULL_37_9]OGE34984.1 MAG: hypothetical protein A3E66_04155 [Candidatus Daviesbacteria bacterium RIFCSPHIGHO2_12_FULL_37_16]
MQIIFDLFNTLFFAPLVNLLVLIIRALESLGVAGALGFAIIIMTIGIRLLIWPFMSSQLKSAKKMADMKPHLDQLKNKHKDDKQALAKAQMDLYKEHGVNPAGGCVPALIQLPILIALYQVILAMFDGANGLERINKVLYNSSWHLSSPPDPHFLGFNLGSKPSDFAAVGVFVLLIPIITGLLQFFQSKMMVPTPVKVYPKDSPKEKKEKDEASDAAAAVQSQMVYLMPVMIGYFAFSFPIGLSIYWNTFTLLGIYHQYRVGGWGGMKEFVSRLRPLGK